MNIILLLSVFIPFAAAPLCYFIGKKLPACRRVITISVCAVELALAVSMYLHGALHGDTIFAALPFVPADISFTADGFRSLYAVMTAFMWLTTAMFSPEYFAHYSNLGRYTFFYLVTLGATMGVFLSADLITTFLFFEIVSFSSFVWVLHDGSKAAISAAKTYLSVAVFGGMALLCGLVFLYKYTDTLVISELSAAAGAIPAPALYGIGVCLLLGFSAKAGVFPLHIWLPKAHPVAPAPASALLSGVLTKVGVYGIIITSVKLFSGNVGWGVLLLMLGYITMLLGALTALLSVDIKRTLACSSMSQIGFITIGIATLVLTGGGDAADGNAAAGVILYMLNHSGMKLILFLIAGVVFIQLHKLNLNDIRGCGRGHYAVAALFILGGAGLAGVPGTGGYIAKTLIHDALNECVSVLPAAAVTAAEWLFIFGGGCTLAYMIKLFVVVFIEKPTDKQSGTDIIKTLRPLTVAALILSAFPPLFTAIPAVSQYIYGRAASFAGGTGAYTAVIYGAEPLSGALISMTIGVTVYFLFVRTATRRRGEYVNILPDWFDLERTVYVPFIKMTMKIACGTAKLFGENMITARLARIIKTSAEIVFHALADTVDGVIYFLWRTLFRDSDYISRIKNTDAENDGEVSVKKESFWRRARRELRTEVTILTSDVTDNFSYALLLTCIGVCIILIYLFVSA